MKVWGETWTRGAEVVFLDDQPILMSIDDGTKLLKEREIVATARCQLAAQAPAMARLLLKLHKLNMWPGDAYEWDANDILRAAGVLP